MKWTNTTVGSFLPFTYGKAITKDKQLSAGFPVYGSNGVYARSAKSLAGPYVVIIGRKGSVGKVHLSETPCWVSDTAFYIQFDSFEDAYFAYFILSKLGLETMNTDAAVPGLNRDNAHRLELTVPAEAQHRHELIKPLIDLDKKIKINQQINQTLEQMAQAIFKSWFVDFEPVKAKIATLEAGGSEEDALLAAMQAISGKDTAQLAQLQAEHPDQYTELRTTAELFPSAMHDSELGEIPEGWTVSKIEAIVERLKSKKRYSKNEVLANGSTPVYEQGANIILGYHNDKPSFHANADAPLFIFGDHTCITHISCQDFDISQNVITLKGRERPTIWTYFAVQGKQTFQEYRRHWSEFIIKPVILPSVGLCERYSKIVSKFLTISESLGHENISLSSLRDELLPKLLSGELEI